MPEGTATIDSEREIPNLSVTYYIKASLNAVSLGSYGLGSMSVSL